jgi:hypothetical protein
MYALYWRKEETTAGLGCAVLSTELDTKSINCFSSIAMSPDSFRVYLKWRFSRYDFEIQYTVPST